MRALTIGNAVAFVVCVLWLARLALPYEQAVRLRNAFLLRRGRTDEFEWIPDTAPQDFAAERAQCPAIIAEAVERVGAKNGDSDWTRMRRLVTMLVEHAAHPVPIQADLVTTYQEILKGAGYCSDFVRVYLAASHAAGLFSRQWAFSFDGFGGHGHTFVEVYDRQREHWIFLDVHNNVYAVRAGSDEPLAALQLRELLVNDPQSIEFRPVGPGRLGFPRDDKLLEYFSRGVGQWYMWWGNDVISRDLLGLNRILGKVSKRFARYAANILGVLPRLRVLTTAANEDAVARMEGLRRRAAIVGVICIVLSLLVVVQCTMAIAGNIG